MADSANTTVTSAIEDASGVQLTAKGEVYVAAHLRPDGCPIGVDPADWRRAVTARIEELQDAQSALIAALDRMDGDSDIEEDGNDEPGTWPELQFARIHDAGAPDGDEDDDTAEPTLGANEPRLGLVSIHEISMMVVGRLFCSQTRWGMSDRREGEYESVNEDGGSNEDGAAWQEAIDQTVLVQP